MAESLIVMTVEPDAVELVADALLRAGASAVEERREDDGRVVLLSDARPSVIDEVSRMPGVVGAVEARAIIDDGLDGWRLYARPVRAGARFVIRPAWLKPVDDTHTGDVELVIDPGRAFGSGSHATTRLALAALEQLVADDSAVLDVGCGSGVLAIGAARLGARTVVAVDVDAAALAATEANVAVNAVADRVTVAEGPVSELSGAWSIVVANISSVVLRELAPHLIAHLVPAGHLIVTGMLCDQLDDVVAAFPTCRTVAVTVEDGWACALLRSRPQGGHQ